MKKLEVGWYCHVGNVNNIEIMFKVSLKASE